MPNHQPLDNVTHQDVKVNITHHPRFGDNDSYARLVLAELEAAQADYPIFFRKQSETGQFEVIALLGLEAQENLFLDDSGWEAHYLPLSIQRRPFLIGLQHDTSGLNAEPQPVVHIDMDSPRVNDAEGEPVFLPQGGQSPYLQHISSVLRALHEGLPQVEPFTQMLQEEELIEPVNLNVQLDNGETLEVGSLYTVNTERLDDLDAEGLARLHKNGYLHAIYMMIASVGNLTKLIERKNARG